MTADRSEAVRAALRDPGWDTVDGGALLDGVRARAEVLHRRRRSRRVAAAVVAVVVVLGGASATAGAFAPRPAELTPAGPVGPPPPAPTRLPSAEVPGPTVAPGPVAVEPDPVPPGPLEPPSTVAPDASPAPG